MGHMIMRMINFNVKTAKFIWTISPDNIKIVIIGLAVKHFLYHCPTWSFMTYFYYE